MIIREGLAIISSVENAEKIKRVKVFMDWAIATSDRNGNKSLNSMIVEDTNWIIEEAKYAEKIKTHHEEFVNTAYDVLKKEEDKIKCYRAEIKQLREALEEIKSEGYMELYGGYVYGGKSHGNCIRIAKNALGGQANG